MQGCLPKGFLHCTNACALPNKDVGLVYICIVQNHDWPLAWCLSKTCDENQWWKNNMMMLSKLSYGNLLFFWNSDHSSLANISILLSTHCLKITKNVAFEFFNLDIFYKNLLTCLVTLFDCKFFQKLAKIDHFWHF